MRCLLAAIACHALSPQQRCIHRREAPQQRRIHRREALRGVAALVAAAPGIAVASTNNTSPTAPRAINASTPRANVSEALSKNKMVVKQRKNLLVENVVDPASGEVLEEFRLPPWWPKRLRPPRRLARGVSNAELALAGFAAGGLTEIARVAALHPLSTVKTRSQGAYEGDDIFADLYAGAGPSIAAAAPAAATYYLVRDRAGKESEIPNFKGSDLGRFPLVSADFWTSDHLSERSRSVDAVLGTRARGTLTLKRR